MRIRSPQRRRSELSRIESRQALGFISPALLGFAIFTAMPVVLSIIMSFHDWPAWGDREAVGFDNFIYLFTEDPNFLAALRNSAVFAILYVPANVIVALSLALLLSPRIRGRGIFRVLFFIPVVTPMVANVLVWKMLLQPRGLFNGLSVSIFGIELPNFLVDPQWAMIMIVIMSVWQGMGYNMLVFSAALEQMPEAVLEAAEIDGARGFTLLRKIKLPLISPSIFFAVIMTMISALQVFAQPQLLTGGGPRNATLPLVMYIYNQGFNFHQLGLAAAAAWILFIIIIGITAVQFSVQKRVVHYES